MFDFFDFTSKELISLSGGGGKTSLLFALSRFFLPRPSILTTTTKIAVPTDGEIPLFTGEMAACARAASLAPCARAIYARSERGEKLIGFSACEVDDLYRESGVCVLVEADGARGLPFKAYREHEPVIPLLSTRLIVLVGAEIFLQKPDESAVFRSDELRRRWDFDEDEAMGIPLIARMLEDKRGYLHRAPDASLCRRALFINKSDLLDSAQIALIADELGACLTQYHDLCIGSLREERVDYHRALREFPR